MAHAASHYDSSVQAADCCFLKKLIDGATFTRKQRDEQFRILQKKKQLYNHFCEFEKLINIYLLAHFLVVPFKSF